MPHIQAGKKPRLPGFVPASHAPEVYDWSTTMQWTPEHSQHLHQWQAQRLDAPPGPSLPLHKADGAFRGPVQPFRYSWANDNISELTASNLLKKYAEKYAGAVAAEPGVSDATLTLTNTQKPDGMSWPVAIGTDASYTLSCLPDLGCSGKSSNGTQLTSAHPLAVNSSLMTSVLPGSIYPVPENRTISVQHSTAATTQVFPVGYSNGTYAPGFVETTSATAMPSPRPSPARSAGLLASEAPPPASAAMLASSQAYSYSSPPYGPQSASPGYSPGGHPLAPPGYATLSSGSMSAPAYSYHPGHVSPTGAGPGVPSSLKRKASFISEDGDDDSGYGSFGCKQQAQVPGAFTSQMYRPFEGYESSDEAGFQPVVPPGQLGGSEPAARKFGGEPNHALHHQSSSHAPVKQGSGAQGSNDDPFNSKYIAPPPPPPPLPTDSSEDYQPPGVPWSLARTDASESTRSFSPDAVDSSLLELVTREVLDSSPPVRWDDVAGLDRAKAALRDCVLWPLLRPDMFSGIQTSSPPRAVFMFGPPGSGKRLLGKCLTGQAGAAFLRVGGASLASKRPTEAERLLDAIFAAAACHQPAVIFMDGIEAVLPQCSEGGDATHLATRLMLHLDRIRLTALTSKVYRVVFVATSTRPRDVDEGALRYFARNIYVPAPDGPARHQILLRFLARRGYSLGSDEMALLLSRTDGFSGADLASICYKAFTQSSSGQGGSRAGGRTPEAQIVYADFDRALRSVRASTSPKDLETFPGGDSSRENLPDKRFDQFHI
uniref:Fidgetin n=1 Tax=Eptatretus burgeri TaxID=7764 RepID=A0A8C4PVU5_EPTBU